ncbi:hypothetical protein BJ138DRAFT_1112039 [Hygrophoropsis aurantiaca]|uniref:Uncharacterized protein n=1 Tax=Hygrophoropsis aurantiaca TaxID=72124 RepID=A0ACB8AHK6_9AGAM|nr:hypothetical protein BJ138DRAFT_1112039 [Hygrophoropsis aurantiaca]
MVSYMQTVLFIALVALSAVVKASPVGHEGAYAGVAASMGLQELTEAEVLTGADKTSPGVFEFNPGE